MKSGKIQPEDFGGQDSTDFDPDSPQKHDYDTLETRREPSTPIHTPSVYPVMGQTRPSAPPGSQMQSPVEADDELKVPLIAPVDEDEVLPNFVDVFDLHSYSFRARGSRNHLLVP